VVPAPSAWVNGRLTRRHARRALTRRRRGPGWWPPRPSRRLRPVVIPGLGVAAVVVCGLGVAAVVVCGLGVPAVVVKGPGACRNLNRDTLRKRRIAYQAGDAGHACDRDHRRGDQQFLHGFFLPWDRCRYSNPDHG
jgi:hypothetical protein